MSCAHIDRTQINKGLLRLRAMNHSQLHTVKVVSLHQLMLHSGSVYFLAHQYCSREAYLSTDMFVWTCS